MKNPTESREYNIEVLTPIHVGSGRELFGKYDYYLENGRIRVVDMESVIESLEENDAAIKEFGREDFIIHQFLRDYSIRPEGYALGWKTMKAALPAKKSKNSSVPVSHTLQEQLTKAFKTNIPTNTSKDIHDLPQSIREHIKTAFGKPYIPGSSIKGSIRTAILSQLITKNSSWVVRNMPQSGKDCPRDKFASAKVIKAYFGKDSNHDILRCLHVGDACFDSTDLHCKDVRLFSLRSSDRAGWRDIRTKKTGSNWKVSGAYVEALQLGASSSLVIQWDRFLLGDSKANKILHFADKTDLFSSVTSLAKTMNDHAKRRLEDEKLFFNTYNLNQLRHQHETLEKTISGGLPEGAFLMQMAWGSGWKGMTGDWMEAKKQKQMRELYELGKFFMEGNIICPLCKKGARPDRRKHGNGFCRSCKKSFPVSIKKTMFEIFPKTRRLVFENGKPMYPFGWLKLTPKGKEDDNDSRDE